MKNPSSTLENNHRSGEALQELKRILETIPPGKVRDPGPLPAKEIAPGPAPEWQNRNQSPKDSSLEWKKKKTASPKTTVVKSIIIDRNDRWHESASVDLHGMDASAFTWGYYGTSYPVLVEDNAGKLQPFYLPDAAGESSNRLYKGANPEGFRNTFKHRSTILQKIQLGMMVVLCLGLFFLIFVFVNQ